MNKVVSLILFFTVKQKFTEFTLVNADLQTGRTHQIRVHCQYLGFPIAGDDKYGNFELNRQLAKQGLKRMFYMLIMSSLSIQLHKN